MQATVSMRLLALCQLMMPKSGQYKIVFWNKHVGKLLRYQLVMDFPQSLEEMDNKAYCVLIVYLKYEYKM